MDPIRSRTPSPARELLPGPQPDGVQPTADRGVSPPAGGPLDGLPARRTMSRTRLPSPPAPLPAFSAGSFSDLLRQFDPSLFNTSLFDSLPPFGAHHTEAATGEWDEVQSGLRAADAPPPTMRVAVTAARPPRAKPAPRRRAAQPSDASPAAQVDLRTLGYSQQQQEKIKPKVRSTVAQHHEALVGHGFTHAHIVALSQHPAALGTVAVKYQDMIAALPEATHEAIVGVGKQWSGARALEALLTVAGELRGPPLQLDTGQLLKIAKRGGVTAVEAVHAWRNALTGAPLNLTPEQVVAIASNIGGKQALETVQALLPVLCQAHGLTPDQVVAIASNGGGKQALETVQRLLPVLCQAHGLTPEQVVAIASNIGGKQALETVQRLLPVLCQAHGLTPEQVVAIASHDGGKQALETVQRLLPVLCQAHGLTPEQVVAIASHDGGKQALETVQRLLPVLCQAHGLTPEQVVAIASHDGGKQALETVQRLLPVLCQAHGLTPEQVVAIASHDGGKQALETVQRLLPVLCQAHGLTPEQVVAIASNGGGKQALETVQRLLPVLCQAHGLTPEQVVAIASHDGGKQALETVQRLLPVLCQAHGLTPEQVVAIASHDGGKQALETVQRLLPVLCQAHGLTLDQVVAIASNGGGKQALETVQRLLPVLCQAHGLTPEQVVAIASNGGGKQALESIVAQLSRPDPALAALTNDHLVALACLGGRPALDAVKKGLPHAPALIKRTNRRIPERTSHRVADHAQVVRVLGFFQCHSHPAQAFDDAMTQFGMSRHGLVQLFRRVGVTELEARSGTLPPASQRWDRILQASGMKRAKPSPTSTQTPDQASLHAFADSLERDLDAPSPMHEGDQTRASSRKRSRSDRAVTGPSAQQSFEVRVPEQRDALHLPLSWRVKRPRTSIGGGLPDPGTPTAADLAASSTVMREQDEDPFAGAADDFPAFNEEELAWLMELLPQ
ncbi:TAL effector repeat-containing protein [Xanthomonas citri pv. malvacearum]|uniref:type III secretion system effector avirulence protein AvrBs3 n=1 Tax=Xanthomonas citri TaxID=346 RepID=UPI000BAC72A2|nr:type III secretion system effector avirulence protein AvrBs3 [Xanthomonas citri]ASY84696.1 avirulence protein [Xanthomonas citri pv. malvacearum]QGL18082.1 avirulence protein [Xanthomonas citri pv. malvacearum]WAW85170.1 TAL effector repeat-containing protein [Xanthomonas citri pv. malvacearum]WAW93525.1 TAL effector repeat-containing protein [Xanthomonas citri pv. malvacearum]